MTKENTENTEATPEAEGKDQLTFLRHASWVGPEDFTSTMLIAGVGAVGSNLAMMLARMGAQDFLIYDDDRVEGHNLPNQHYIASDLGKPKVEALRDRLQAFNPGIQVRILNRRLEPGDEDFAALEDCYFFAASDSMKARSNFIKMCALNPSVSLFCDTRLGFEFGSVFVVDPFSEQQLGAYLSTIRNDDEVEEGPCNRRLCAPLVGFAVSQLVFVVCEMLSKKRVLEEYDPYFRYDLVWAENQMTIAPSSLWSDISSSYDEDGEPRYQDFLIAAFEDSSPVVEETAPQTPVAEDEVEAIKLDF